MNEPKELMREQITALLDIANKGDKWRMRNGEIATLDFRILPPAGTAATLLMRLGKEGSAKWYQRTGQEYATNPNSELDLVLPLEAEGRQSVHLSTFSDFQRANKYRCILDYPETHLWTLSDWMVRLVSEVGEASQVLTDALLGKGMNNKALRAELADVVTCCFLLASNQGIDLARALAEKFNEVSERKGSRFKMEVP